MARARTDTVPWSSTSGVTPEKRSERPSISFMTNVRPVSPSATMMMIAAVPTTSPASVSAVWTGCVRKRWTAVSKVSGVNIGTPLRARGGHVDARALGERDEAGQQDRVVVRQARGDLDVVDADEADRHLAPLRPG